MTHQGRLVEWNDKRGFGFVTPLEGGSSAFVHISRFPRHLKRPKLNDLLVYSIEYDERGRPRASDISFLRSAHNKLESNGNWPLVPVFVVSAFLVALAIAILIGTLQPIFLGLYAFMSILLYLIYAGDKSAAQSGRWRTSETTLHLVAILGGWPGGLIARHKLRHKTIKQPFRLFFWCTVVINVIGLIYISSSISSGPG